MGLEGPRDNKVESGKREWEDCPACRGKGQTQGRGCTSCRGTGKLRPASAR